jgi:hypothetical protein
MPSALTKILLTLACVQTTRHLITYFALKKMYLKTKFQSLKFCLCVLILEVYLMLVFFASIYTLLSSRRKRTTSIQTIITHGVFFLGAKSPQGYFPK